MSSKLGSSDQSSLILFHASLSLLPCNINDDDDDCEMHFTFYITCRFSLLSQKHTLSKLHYNRLIDKTKTLGVETWFDSIIIFLASSFPSCHRLSQTNCLTKSNNKLMWLKQQQNGKKDQRWHLDVSSRDLELHSMHLRNQTWWLRLSRSERTLGSRSQEVHQRRLLFPSSSQERRLWQSHAWVLEIREGIVNCTCCWDANWFLFVLLQIHVNLMIAEARMQAALLYALRAVMRFMTWRNFCHRDH